MRKQIAGVALGLALLVAGSAAAQQVSKATVPGVTNFVKLESTIACAGATTAAGVGEVKKLGYKSIINLRQANEPGAEVEAEAAAAKQAGVKYVHLPLNGSNPDVAVVDQFLQAVADPAAQPVFIHCASGNRAAAMWMIKRMVVDGWAADKAGEEATALGLTSPALRTFALDYAAAHKQ